MTNRLPITQATQPDGSYGIGSSWVSDGDSTMRETPFSEGSVTSYILWRQNFISWVSRMLGIEFHQLEENHFTRVPGYQSPYHHLNSALSGGPSEAHDHKYLAAHTVLGNSIPNGRLKAGLQSISAGTLNQKVTFIDNWMARAFDTHFLNQCHALVINQNDSLLSTIYKLDYLAIAFTEYIDIRGSGPLNDYYLMETFCNTLHGCDSRYRRYTEEYRRRATFKTTTSMDTIGCVRELADKLRQEAQQQQIREARLHSGSTGQSRKRGCDDDDGDIGGSAKRSAC